MEPEGNEGVTHPLIANRLIRLAGMVGFDLNDAGNVINVDKVDIKLLQTAALGFKTGLSLGDVKPKAKLDITDGDVDLTTLPYLKMNVYGFRIQ